MKIILPILTVLLLAVACKPDPVSKMQDLSLLQYGMPITIKAPDGVEVKKSDLGIFQDVTVKNEEGYYVQVLASDATTVDVAKIKTDLLEDIKRTPFFSKIIEEGEDGFIYEKQVDSTSINYSFRRIMVMGDKEFVFQPGLIGKFSEEQVRTMYDAVIPK